jgi:hypothetical protein
MICTKCNCRPAVAGFRNCHPCREYRHAHYRANRERVLADSALWKKAHHAAELLQRRARYLRRRAEVLRIAKSYRRAHPEIYAEAQRRRRARRVQWADKTAIKAIYAEAARLTRETGVPHEVDHVVPVQGREVCGLHVENNLQIITREANRRKSRASL